MSIKDLIENRRSIRRHEQKQVEASVLNELLHLSAGLCPHPQRLEGTRFLLANEQDTRSRLSRTMTDAFSLTKLGKWLPDKLLEATYNRFMEIPGHLVVITEQEDEYIAEASYMMQSLQLLAWERGIGMLWDTDELLYSPKLLESLSLKQNERMLGIIHYGYFIKAPRPRKRTPATKRWIVYSATE
ncbi:nitroreductase family protein [Paenibacillus radicis (ex Gao et al. 2016)]|uniref:NAD(P)H nitroreductase YfhC n=1 Tax=Paenibacillus radicis (ex Gao et al. 2016) TaxID=1737354 RepID=A0A917LRN5_9BACL|nr:nitroreductase family protein [Paenibacillus radicis (ex Gao et al. 2016)]GGG53044.1 putative NAD(P)H nitroreductase YfhC [Paenibacillus radicis (ex Gao et al. 2016)]